VTTATVPTISMTAISMIPMATTPPWTTAVVVTAAADSDASFTSMSRSNDHAGHQGHGVEQNDRSAAHLG
jgi:hypothetical protein